MDKYWIIINNDGYEVNKVWSHTGEEPSDFDANYWIEVPEDFVSEGLMYDDTAWIEATLENS